MGVFLLFRASVRSWLPGPPLVPGVFKVEPHDVEVLEGCKENVVNKGGFILLGKIQNNVVATISFMKLAEGVFELGK